MDYKNKKKVSELVSSIEEDLISPGVIIFITGKEFFENEKCLGFYNEGKFSEDVVNKYLISSGRIGE